jgi:hydrogenase-4 component E
MDNTVLIRSNLVVTLMIAHLIASLLAVEVRNLRYSVACLAMQSALLASVFGAFAHLTSTPTLYYWALTAVVTKVVIIPGLLWYHIARLPEREIRPVIGFRVSIAIVAILVVICYRFMHTYVQFVAPTAEATVEPARSSLAVAFTVFALGLYVLMVRRDAVKIIIGLILLENGTHLSLVTLAPTLPETTILGVTTNVIVTVWVLLYLVSQAFERLGITDTIDLSQLKH